MLFKRLVQAAVAVLALAAAVPGSAGARGLVADLDANSVDIM